jgi:pectin methylesterase-like acyl-CoA thioesterase
VPTGNSCDPEIDICLDAAAVCTRYFSDDPAGTFCLIPNGGACTAPTECASQLCASGACLAETCTVCASGCDYTTIKEAVGSATSGGVITIDSGVYPTQVFLNQDITLRACNGVTDAVVDLADGDTYAIWEDTSATPFAVTL